MTKLFESYLKANEVTIEEFHAEEKRLERLQYAQLVANIIGKFYNPIFGLAFGGAAAILFGLIFPVTQWIPLWLQVAIVTSSTIALIMFYMIDLKLQKMDAAISKKFSVAVFQTLKDQFVRLFGINKDVADRLHEDELRAVVQLRLKAMAQQLQEKQATQVVNGVPNEALRLRTEFRECHNNAFLLGLCKPDWNTYFVA